MGLHQYTSEQASLKNLRVLHARPDSDSVRSPMDRMCCAYDLQRKTPDIMFLLALIIALITNVERTGLLVFKNSTMS